MAGTAHVCVHCAAAGLCLKAQAYVLLVPACSVAIDVAHTQTGSGDATPASTRRIARVASACADAVEGNAPLATFTLAAFLEALACAPDVTASCAGWVDAIYALATRICTLCLHLAVSSTAVGAVATKVGRLAVMAYDPARLLTRDSVN